MPRRIFVSAFAALALAACTPAPAPSSESAPASGVAAALATAAIDLQPITFPLTGAELVGELGCTFRDAAGEMLLVSSGYVQAADPGTAVVRVGAAAQNLLSDTADGYDGIVDGATFVNPTISATVAIGAELPNMGEQVGHAATLTATIGAESRAYEGTWTCGP